MERLQEALRTQPVDGALIVQKADIYYLSGTDQDAHLWVPAKGAALLMVRRSFERAKKKTLCLKESFPFRDSQTCPSS